MQKSGSRKEGEERLHTRKQVRETAVALAAAAKLLSPAEAHAMPKLRTEPPAPEKPPGLEVAGRRVAESGNVSAEVEVLGSTGDLTTMRITYETKERGEPVTFYGPPDTGKVVFVLPGPERTVVITENDVIITVGYEANLREQDYLVMDGRPLRIHGHTEPMNSYFYDLPASLIEVGLVSAAVARNPVGDSSTLFLLAADGHLRAARVELTSEPYIHENLGISEGSQLLSAGAFAVLYTPGSAEIRVISAVFEGGRRMEVEPVQLPAAPQGRISVRERGLDCVLSFSGMEVLLMAAEPGNPHSVIPVTVRGQ